MTMRRVKIATVEGFLDATCLASQGDWAITVRGGELQSLTHLPTGARCCTVESERDYAALPKAMQVLAADVPSFDVQTFEAMKSLLELVLDRFGLRPLWRKDRKERA